MTIKKCLVAGVLAITLGISLFYAVHTVRHFSGRGWTYRDDMDTFADEARRTIPENDRVLVRGDVKLSNELSARLHPRLLVNDGPSQWIIEIATGPNGRLDRARSSIRKATP